MPDNETVREAYWNSGARAVMVMLWCFLCCFERSLDFSVLNDKFLPPVDILSPDGFLLSEGDSSVPVVVDK